MEKPVQISVIIITFNEEKNIGRCIDSVQTFADEVIVVDSYSKDNTKQICLAKEVRFVEHPFEGHIQQKNFALSLARFDYVFAIDADEYLSIQLANSIVKAKKQWVGHAYKMNRLSSYGGKWIKHGNWYPDQKIRLWDKRFGSWGGENPHDKVILAKNSKVTHLLGDLMHTAYQDGQETLAKIQQYSSIFARENAGKRSTSILKIVGHTFFSFCKSYFLKVGFLDGFEGLAVAAAEANHVFYKYSKLYEANKILKTSLIITTYNRKDALELVLISVKRQTNLPEEVIVADDGSGEDTRQLIEQYQKSFPVPLIHCWHEDLGFRLSTIRNSAISMAKYEYIIMIDGDIVLPKNFIRAHKAHAWKGQFIQGSRLLLLKKQTEKMLREQKTFLSFMATGIDNRLNAIENRLLSKIFSRNRTGHYNVRGANLSFWKEDLLAVNGFNEDFVGWGREDSEFAVRMENKGIKRKHLKFAGFGYHLYHPEYSRNHLPINDLILEKTVKLHLTRCENGIHKSLVTEGTPQL
jgi:glycosyltransferase involved in cell wall biosynthesis